MSSVLALEERTSPVPKTPEDPKQLVAELRRHATNLDVIARLTAFNQALSITQSAAPELGPGKWLYLLELSFDDPANPELQVSAFPFKDQQYAMQEYEAIEQKTADDTARDVVLVQSGDLTSVRRAYPNYYLDTDVFVQSVQSALN